MFAICKDTMRVLFAFGDRDLALAFADLEGFDVVDWSGTKRAKPVPVVFNESFKAGKRILGAQPEQVRPGVFAYRIRVRKKASMRDVSGSKEENVRL